MITEEKLKFMSDVIDVLEHLLKQVDTYDMGHDANEAINGILDAIHTVKYAIDRGVTTRKEAVNIDCEEYVKKMGIKIP